MRIAGQSPALTARFFPESFVVRVLRFILDAWPSLTPPPRPDEKEEQITGRFCEHLIDQAPSELPLFIEPERPIYDRVTGKVLGRTDLRFHHTGNIRDRLFLVVETKRLRIPKKTRPLFRNTAAYCGSEGMERFVSGKYSSGLPEGAMLAYVMDGDITTAASEVGVFCESKKRRALAAPNRPVIGAHPAMPPPSARSDHHRLTEHGGPLTLHHLFVAV